MFGCAWHLDGVNVAYDNHMCIYGAHFGIGLDGKEVSTQMYYSVPFVDLYILSVLKLQHQTVGETESVWMKPHSAQFMCFYLRDMISEMFVALHNRPKPRNRRT